MPSYRFYRESAGEWIDAGQPERWRWEAHYTDGSVLYQWDDQTGLFHQFKEIEQDKLSYFAMVSTGLPPLILHWRSGMKLIHFYSNIMAMVIGGNGELKQSRIYHFGYQEGPHKVIVCIMPDDGVVITDDHNKVKVKV